MLPAMTEFALADVGGEHQLLEPLWDDGERLPAELAASSLPGLTELKHSRINAAYGNLQAPATRQHWTAGIRSGRTTTSSADVWIMAWSL